jgi:hypothetical protein
MPTFGKKQKWISATPTSLIDPKPIAFGVSGEANAQISAGHLE